MTVRGETSENNVTGTNPEVARDCDRERRSDARGRPRGSRLPPPCCDVVVSDPHRARTSRIRGAERNARRTPCNDGMPRVQRMTSRASRVRRPCDVQILRAL